MDPDSIVYSIVATVLFVLMGGFLTLCETAAVELGDAKLKREAESDPRAARLYALTQRPGNFIFALQAGSALFCYLGVGLASFVLLPALLRCTWLAPLFVTQGAFAGLALCLFVLLLAVFITLFARALPRQLGIRYCQTLAYDLSAAIGLFARLFRPFAGLAEALEKLVSRLFLGGADIAPPVTEEEIRMMVDISGEHGSIERAEKEMINNIFEFDNRTVEEVMTHRTDLAMIEVGDTLGEALDLSIQLGFSRIPVYAVTPDHIEGVLYIKDILPLVAEGRWRGVAIRKVMRQTLFVPESTHCMDLFLEFKAKKMQFAVVVDEYGGTSGVVTMEDLLESIVGSMQDEYDNEDEDVQQHSDSLYTLDGSLTLDEVERTLDIHLPEDAEYETIGGLLVELLDRIPAPDEKASVEMDGWRFTVLEVDDRHVSKIRAELIHSQPEGQQDP